MSAWEDLKGSLVALVTPMKANGAVDWAVLDGLIEWHLESGTSGIVAVGTTGESATLSAAEHQRVVAATVRRVDGRVPVIAGTGANATAEAIEYTRAAHGDGADYGLAVTPYYNKPPQEGLYRHYCAIAEAVPLPMVLYNVPPRTACDMQAATVARLARVDGIVGIKEACGDADRVAEIKELAPEGFVLLSGEDAQTLAMAPARRARGHLRNGQRGAGADGGLLRGFPGRRFCRRARPRRPAPTPPRGPFLGIQPHSHQVGVGRDGPNRGRHSSAVD